VNMPVAVLVRGGSDVGMLVGGGRAGSSNLTKSFRDSNSSNGSLNNNLAVHDFDAIDLDVDAVFRQLRSSCFDVLPSLIDAGGILNRIGIGHKRAFQNALFRAIVDQVFDDGIIHLADRTRQRGIPLLLQVLSSLIPTSRNGL